MPSKPPKTVNANVLQAVPMSLFPTLDSLQDVVDLANSKLPLTHQNEMFSLLMTMQNTVLAVLEKGQQ